MTTPSLPAAAFGAQTAAGGNAFRWRGLGDGGRRRGQAELRQALLPSREIERRLAAEGGALAGGIGGSRRHQATAGIGRKNSAAAPRAPIGGVKISAANGKAEGAGRRAAAIGGKWAAAMAPLTGENRQLSRRGACLRTRQRLPVWRRGAALRAAYHAHRSCWRHGSEASVATRRRAFAISWHDVLLLIAPL